MVKSEYITLNSFDERKYLNLVSLLMCVAFRQKSREAIGVGLDGFSYCENTHIPFFKNLFLMLTESNSRNFLSEIITSNLQKWLIKIYRFQWDFSLQILSHCLCILCDFPKGSPVSFNLLYTNIYIYIFIIIFMNFESAPFFCLPFKFQPAIYSKTANFIHWILSFLPKVLLQMRHLSSSSILLQYCCNLSCDIYIISFVQSVISHSSLSLSSFRGR